MSRWAKVGVVVAGYLAAVVAGVVAAWLYNVRVSALPYDTSGGMYAGGEAITSLGVFLVVALLPTLLALWFLRRHEGFWNVVGVGAIAFAGGGLLAVLSPMAFQATTMGLGGLFLELLRVSHLLGAPLWFVAFVLFAFIAPSRTSRRTLVTATAIEAVVGACVFVHWFIPGTKW